MKRILALMVLLTVACIVSPLSALAQTGGSPWVFDNVSWRTNRDGGFIDSSYVIANNTAAAHSATAQSDTTAPFMLSNVPWPTSSVTASALDSITGMTFCVGGLTAAPTMDSIYVGMQVSIDGISWVPLVVTGGPAGTWLKDAQITGKPPIGSAGVIEASTSNQACLDYNVVVIAGSKYTMSANGAASTTNTTDQQWYGWRYARWIVTWSIVDGGSTFQAWVGHQYQAPILDRSR